MIDEKKLISFINTQINPYGKPFEGTAYEFGLKLMDYIEHMEKSVEWIPCRERLPEHEYDAVLVFLRSDIYDVAIWTSEHGFRPWYSAYFEEATPEWEKPVIAWMPLPEPYKGE